jgi:hypothetical protein
VVLVQAATKRRAKSDPRRMASTTPRGRGASRSWSSLQRRLAIRRDPDGDMTPSRPRWNLAFHEQCTCRRKVCEGR